LLAEDGDSINNQIEEQCLRRVTFSVADRAWFRRSDFDEHVFATIVPARMTA
jgi:hypothetical protein